MSPDTFKHTLAALCGRRPFRPFAVELDDGTRLEIDQRHAVVTRNGVASFFAPDGKMVWFDPLSVTRFLDDRPDANRVEAA